jgi:hypothetical protein
MRTLYFSFFIIFFTVVSLHAHTLQGEKLAQRLKLNAASKAIIQWERVFSCQRKRQRYKINTLSPQEEKVLKDYLINHAVDSDHPTIAGAY